MRAVGCLVVIAVATPGFAADVGAQLSLDPAVPRVPCAPGGQSGQVAAACTTGAWVLFTDDRRHPLASDIEGFFWALQPGSPKLEVSIADAPLDQRAPAIACEGASCIATWVDRQQRVMARRLGCDGTVGGDVVQVSGSATGIIDAQAVAISNGEALVVWNRGYGNLEAAVVSAALDATLVAPVNIATSMNGDYFFSVGAAPEGNGFVVGYAFTDTTEHIGAMHVQRMGSAVQATPRVDYATYSSGGAGTRVTACGSAVGSVLNGATSAQPAVVRVRGAAGGLVGTVSLGTVAPLDGTITSNGARCVLAASIGGGLFRATIGLDGAGATPYSPWTTLPGTVLAPAIAANATAELAAYTPYRAGGPGDVLYTTLPVTLGAVSYAGVQVLDGGTVQGQPAAAWTGSGWLAAWDDERAPLREARLQWLDARGRPTGPSLGVSEAVPGLDAGHETVSIAVGSSSLATCLATSDDEGNVWASCAPPGGPGAFGAATRIGTIAASQLAAATTTGGTTLFSWTSYTVADGFRSMGSRVRGTLVLDAPDTVLGATSSSDSAPRACAEGDHFWVIRGALGQVRLRQVPELGALVADPGAVAPTGLYPIESDVACGPDGVLAVWSEYTAGPRAEVFASLYTDAGFAAPRSVFQGPLFEFASGVLQPRVTWDGVAWRIVVQVSSPARGFDVVLRTLERDGGVSADLALAATDEEEGEGDLAAGSAGQSLAVYRVGTTSGSNVVSRLFSDVPLFGPCFAPAQCRSGACVLSTCCEPMKGNCPDGGSVAPDAGVVDAGVADAGVADAGVPEVDAGLADAGQPPPDGGVSQGEPLRVGCGCTSDATTPLAALLCAGARLLTRRKRKC